MYYLVKETVISSTFQSKKLILILKADEHKFSSTYIMLRAIYYGIYVAGTDESYCPACYQ